MCSHVVCNNFKGFPRGRRDNQYYRGGRGGGGANGTGGGGSGGGGGGRRPDGRQNQGRQGERTPYKYDSEFDFESANARFKKEDLEVEFREKLRFDDRTRKSSEGSSRKASVGSSHNCNESSGEEVEIIEDGASVSDEVEEFYDKSKSFFDNISCEVNAAPSR